MFYVLLKVCSDFLKKIECCHILDFNVSSNGRVCKVYVL